MNPIIQRLYIVQNIRKEDSRHSNPIEDTAENPTTSVENEENTDDCEARYSKLNDFYIHLLTEFNNYRKRTAKERIEFILIEIGRASCRERV